MAKLITLVVLFAVATAYGRSLDLQVVPLTRAARSPCSTCGLSTQNWSGLSKDRNGQSTVFSGASAASNNPLSPVAGEALSLASSAGNGGLDGIGDGLGVFKSSSDNGASSKSASIGLGGETSGISGDATSDGSENSHGNENCAHSGQISQEATNSFSSAQSSSFGSNNRDYGHLRPVGDNYGGSSNNARYEIDHQQQTKGEQKGDFGSGLQEQNSASSNGNQNSYGSGDDRQFGQGSQRHSNSFSSAQSSSSSLGSKNPDYVHPRPVSKDFTGSSNNGQYESFHYLHQNKDRHGAFGSGLEAQSSESSKGNHFESSQRREDSYLSNGNVNAESGLSGSSYGGQTTQNGFGGNGQSGLQKNQAGFESSGSQSSSGNQGSFGSNDNQGSYGSSGNQGSFGSSSHKVSHYSQQSGSGYSSGESAGSTSGSTGAYNSGAGSSSGNAQEVLGGALGLASQGLQAARQSGCTTCPGKSNFALSNAKSWNGNAVALSIGG